MGDKSIACQLKARYLRYLSSRTARRKCSTNNNVAVTPQATAVGVPPRDIIVVSDRHFVDPLVGELGIVSFLVLLMAFVSLQES